MNSDKDTITRLDQREQRHYRAVTTLIRKCKDDIDQKIESAEAKLEKKIQPLHDFVIRQQGFADGVSSKAVEKGISDGSISISKEAWQLIMKIAGFVGTALLIIQTTQS